MAGTNTTKLATILERVGLFTPEQVQDLLARQQQSGQAITDVVVSQGYAKEEPFLEKLAEVMKLPFERVGDKPIDQGVLGKLPTKAVFQYNVIPLAMENGLLRVATHDPFLPGLVDALRLASGFRIRLTLSTSTELAKAAKKFYGVGADTLEQMIQDNRIEVAPEDDLSKNDLSELDQEASVVKFVNQIIWEAYQDRATDIHLEPMESDLRIRYRIDGLLHQTPVPAQLKRFQPAIISRVKVMAGMDIAEKRLPQDGRISLRIRGEEIDVRVSTMPTVYGESVSLRLLMRSSGLIGMDKLGLNPKDEAALKKLIHKPHGILLVTGPTGSGKSTSLYAWLHTINSIDKRILTIEEPIEYEMAGINQIQVRPEIGLTFAVGLRHILRQDPDVIMVGEIRDGETAEIAVQSALTGHMVFSTLHTNDAAGALTRLVEMGIEPFLAASSIVGILAQRLVRRICPDCRESYRPSAEMLREMGLTQAVPADALFHRGKGCPRCMGIGYRGRTGIYELLTMDEEIRDLLLSNKDAAGIKAAAVARGMPTLRDAGLAKALRGETTIEEVLRVTQEEV